MNVKVYEIVAPYGRYGIIDDSGTEIRQVHRDLSVELEWAAANGGNLVEAIVRSEESMSKKSTEVSPSEWLESEIERLSTDIDLAKAVMEEGLTRIKTVIDTYHKGVEESIEDLSRKVASHTHSVRVGRPLYGEKEGSVNG